MAVFAQILRIFVIRKHDGTFNDHSCARPRFEGLAASSAAQDTLEVIDSRLGLKSWTWSGSVLLIVLIIRKLFVSPKGPKCLVSRWMHTKWASGLDRFSRVTNTTRVRMTCVLFLATSPSRRHFPSYSRPINLMHFYVDSLLGSKVDNSLTAAGHCTIIVDHNIAARGYLAV